MKDDTYKTRMTYLLKKSAPKFVLIHSHDSMFGATINPAHFVKIFPLPRSSNTSPSFNCVKLRTMRLSIASGWFKPDIHSSNSLSSMN